MEEKTDSLASTAIRLEGEDVGAGTRLQVEGRHDGRYGMAMGESIMKTRIFIYASVLFSPYLFKIRRWVCKCVSFCDAKTGADCGVGALSSSHTIDRRAQVMDGVEEGRKIYITYQLADEKREVLVISDYYRTYVVLLLVLMP
jgi:hypothetical protein